MEFTRIDNNTKPISTILINSLRSVIAITLYSTNVYQLPHYRIQAFTFDFLHILKARLTFILSGEICEGQQPMFNIIELLTILPFRKINTLLFIQPRPAVRPRPLTITYKNDDNLASFLRSQSNGFEIFNHPPTY